MKLYVFNPDTDLALAYNDGNYMASASIRQMMQDLALLPAWYAPSGSGVLAASAYNADYLQEMQRTFSLAVQLVTEPELTDYADAQAMPWGWNPAIRKRLLKGGMLEQGLPSTQQIAEFRKLSSRETAMTILRLLNEQGQGWSCGQSHRLSCLDSCRSYVEGDEACVLKAPWSGSGKGLNWCRGLFTPSIEGWCERVLREQGFVVGEPLYNKVEDFAMEFYSDGKGGVSFVGYSLFTTNQSGAYSGNVLLSSCDIERLLGEHVPLSTLVCLREKLCNLLADVYGAAYAGYLGVDMMICRHHHHTLIHPCVEINMRMNMGVVSCFLHERFISPSARGRFLIEYYPSNEALRQKHELDLAAYPLIVQSGRVLSGYLPLVPITPKSRYRAYVVV